jgi:3-hydroxyacyl-CoA dehydrogenase
MSLVQTGLPKLPVSLTCGKLKLLNMRCSPSIWAAIKRKALLTASEGAGTPETRHHAVFREVLKTPKGPFQLMDVVGLDVVPDIEKHYASARRNIPVEPQNYLNQFLQKGHLDVKTGRGFYDYGGSPVT